MDGEAKHAQIRYASYRLTIWPILKTIYPTAANQADKLFCMRTQPSEQLNHHPDIAVHDYNRVTVTSTTHDSGGITGHDLRLAAAINTALTVGS